MATMVVTVTEGSKYSIVGDIRTAGGTHVGNWEWDSTSTVVSVVCRFKGRPDQLQDKLWKQGYGWVSVEPFGGRH